MNRDDEIKDDEPTAPLDPRAERPATGPGAPRKRGPSAPDAALPLAGFSLQRVIGQGGEGEVWLGVHETQKLPVAVKVMRSRYAADDLFRARFNGEVRAAAALTHPGIVSILDYGAVDEAAAAQSAGGLAAGCPYLVMELVGGGALKEVFPFRTFEQLRRVLSEVLDALAHAHARGVIHRDIKPSNVLIRRRSRGNPGIVIADFGIAYASSALASPDLARRQSRLRLYRGDPSEHPESTQERTLTSGQGVTAGTPSYMAPEQIHGDLNNQGPWTDLYALGCLAHKLSTGRTPFHAAGQEKEAILRAQLHGVVPAPDFYLAVPRGFEGWLRRLLAKSPWSRYQRVADAKEDLLALDASRAVGVTRAFSVDDDQGGATEIYSPSSEEPPADQDDLRTIPLLTSERPRAIDALEAEPLSVEPKPADGAPVRPFPESWRDHGRSRRPTSLLGAGLGLFGLRAVPFVGREAARDLLWSQLRAVHAEQHPRLVAIHGEAGVGKSRLAQWLTQRADELGWAEVLTATHGEFASHADGLPSMLAQALRCRGLSLKQMRQQSRHVMRALSPNGDSGQDMAELDYLARALTWLMEPCALDSGESAWPARAGELFASQEARWAVVLQLLRLKALQRPVVLWLDDVQWGHEALGLARFLMEADEPVAALVLVTYRDEALPEASRSQKQIEALLQLQGCVDLPLERLPSTAQVELVSNLLGLEPALAQEVGQRTEGNPLFAVQLLGDWVDRGALAASDQGFALRGGEDAGLPDDIHDVWRWRLGRLEERFGADTRWCLELAAALGREVDQRIWYWLCDGAGHPIPEGLTRRLFELRLATETSDGWTFAHALFRESLERLARDEGRWQDHHRRCADVLRLADDIAAPRRSEAIAHHLLAAGEALEAVPLLLKSAEAQLHQANYTRALDLSALLESTLTDSDVDPGDEQYRRGWLVAARARFMQGSFDEAEGLLDRIEAHSFGDIMDAVSAGAQQTRARMLRMRGKLPEALAHAERASEAFRALGDDEAAAASDLITARLHFESTGDYERGLALVGAAREDFRRSGDEGQLGEAHYITALIRQAIGEVDVALEETAQARVHYLEAGHRFGEAACENFLGEIARQTARYDDAETHYRKALRVLASIGSRWTYVQRINIALTLVQSGKLDEAEPLLRGLYTAEFEGQEGILCYCDYALLACNADRERWSDWDRHYEAAYAVRPDTGRVDKDLAQLARIGGELAAAHGKVARAKRALRLSKEHWEALGDADTVRAVDALIEGLE